jgi:hypothetical protein
MSDQVRQPFLLALAILTASAAHPNLAHAAKRGEVEIRVVDSKTNEPIAVRMHLKDAKGKAVKPPKAVYWHDHFVFEGAIKLDLPEGTYSFEMERGPEYKIRTGYFTIEHKASDVKELTMERFIDMTAEGWYSGDLDLQRSGSDIELLMQADDLHVGPVIAWSGKLVAKSGDATPIAFGGNRIYQLLAGRDDRDTSGLLLFNLSEPLDLSKLSKEYPSSASLLDEAKRRGGIAIAERPTCWDLPVWIAAGQLDAVLLAHADLQRDGAPAKDRPGMGRPKTGYPNPHGVGRWSQNVYYQLLECGLRLPPAAGSGSGVAPNPVGYNRVYVHCDGELTWEKWWEGLKAGRVVVTNGPVMQPRVDGRLPGHVFQAEKGESLDLTISLNLSTREKIDYLEVVQNGRVVHEVRLDKWAEAGGMLPPVRFEQSGWLLVRAVTNNGSTYRYATSGPFYVEIGYQPRISKQAAQFFLDWTFERARQLKLDSPEQREEVIGYHRAARDYWQSLLDKATAE